MSQLYPADRACAYCSEPLSIHYDGDRCLHCKHTNKMRQLNPLVRRVETGRRCATVLDRLPRFDDSTNG